jgi:hypothetical protein
VWLHTHLWGKKIAELMQNGEQQPGS